MGLKYALGVRVVANGADITALISDGLTSLEVEDEAGMKSDKATLTLSDTGNYGRIALPSTGAELEIWIGHKNSAVRMGLFAVDEITMSGPPHQMQISAKAMIAEQTPTGKTEIKSQKTRSFEAGLTINDLVSTIAQEHGLEPAVSGSLGGIVLPHIDQVNESDINLLTRIAWDYDAVVKPAGGKLAVVKHGAGVNSSGVSLPSFVITPDMVSQWSVTLSEVGKSESVVAVWRDKDAAADVEVEVGSGEPKQRLRHRYANAQEAQKAAEAGYRRAQRGSGKLSLSMPGDPFIMAESKIVLSGFRVGVDGEWTVKSTKHLVSGSGYKLSLNAELSI